MPGPPPAGDRGAIGGHLVARRAGRQRRARPHRRPYLGRVRTAGDASGGRRGNRPGGQRGDPRVLRRRRLVLRDRRRRRPADRSARLSLRRRAAHRRGRAAVAVALIVGAVAGTFVMLWLGERIGLSSYNKNLASSPKGTLFSASLSLGAKSVLAFWPLFTAIVLLVAEWGTRPAAATGVAARGGPPGTSERADDTAARATARPVPARARGSAPVSARSWSVSGPAWAGAGWASSAARTRLVGTGVGHRWTPAPAPLAVGTAVGAIGTGVARGTARYRAAHAAGAAGRVAGRPRGRRPGRRARGRGRACRR